MLRIYTIITFCLFFSLSFGQNSKNQPGDGIVSGRVLDKVSDVPMEYVSFRLFSIKDSSIVAGIFTDADGKFVLENVPYGTFYGKLSFSGYKTIETDVIKISAAFKVANLGVFKLEIDTIKQIDEVKIVGTLDVLKAGIDKKIYNVGEDLSVKGGTANDILNNIPSVEVDQEGKVTLRGDGAVTVLIDGRPSSLSGGNGKTLLDALPAGSIERIEVVTNPSAKYDPDGTSGIINIVLKKNKLKGFNGLITGNIGSGNLKGGNVFDGSASLSYRNSKVNLYGSYTGRYLDGYRNNYTDLVQEFEDGSITRIKQDRLGTDLNSGNTLRIGSDFYLKARHILGISATGSNGIRNRTGLQESVETDGNADLVSKWWRYADDPTKRINLDVNMNYKYDLKEDRGNLVVDLNRSIGVEDIEGYYNQYYSYSSLVPLYDTAFQQLFNQEKNNITSGQFDLVYIFPKINSRMETGLKGIVKKQGVDTYSETFDATLNKFIEDTLANFQYTYDEQVYGAYVIFGQQLGKFKYQGGLRAEQAYQIPNLISDSNRIVNDYFKLYPSAHVRYSFSDKSEISLSYSKRINRSSSADMNPFTNYADPFNLTRGNPYLQPEYINSYDLGYTNEIKKVTLTTSIFYRQTTDVISRVKNFNLDNTAYVTFANIDESHTFGTEIIMVIKPFKWWRNTLSGNANFTQYVDDNPDQDWNVSGINWNMKYATTIDFWKKTASIQINATYNAPRVTIQGIMQRRGPVDISFEKTFSGGKWTLGARVSDVFDRLGFHADIEREMVNQTVDFKWLSRRYFLTFSYKFGKLEINNRKQSGGEGGGGEM